MQSILILLLFIFIACLPIHSIINWFLNSQQGSSYSSSNSIHFPSNIFNFFIKQLIYFSLGFGLIFASEKLLYFQSDFLILISFLLILTSFFWSIFNSFKAPKYFFFFILGAYTFFSSSFLVFLPLLFLVLSLLTNSIYIGFVSTVLCSFTALVLFETHYLFIGFNSILLILSILRCFNNFTVENSLTHTFKLRN